MGARWSVGVRWGVGGAVAGAWGVRWSVGGAVECGCSGVWSVGAVECGYGAGDVRMWGSVGHQGGRRPLGHAERRGGGTSSHGRGGRRQLLSSGRPLAIIRAHPIPMPDRQLAAHAWAGRGGPPTHLHPCVPLHDGLDEVTEEAGEEDEHLWAVRWAVGRGGAGVRCASMRCGAPRARPHARVQSSAVSCSHVQYNPRGTVCGPQAACTHADYRCELLKCAVQSTGYLAPCPQLPKPIPVSHARCEHCRRCFILNVHRL